MICPVCEKGQLIKVDPSFVRSVKAKVLKCVCCGHTQAYALLIKVA